MSDRKLLESLIEQVKRDSEPGRVALREYEYEAVADASDDELIRIGELLIAFADERK